MKCLFDNNLPPKLAKTLNYLEGDDGIIVQHLRERFPADTPDIEWFKKLSNEGNWFVITKDNQIRKKPHEKEAWKESKIPVVFLLKAWVKYDLWEIAWKFIKYWPKLKESIKQNNKAVTFILSINGNIEVIK